MILVLLAIIILGCAEGPYRSKTRIPVLEDSTPVVLLNEDLVDDIAVDGVVGSYTADRRLHVEAKIRNRTDESKSIQVQTVFKDDRGTEIGDASAWESLVLSANETRGYRATAIRQEARRYTVRVRYQE